MAGSLLKSSIAKDMKNKKKGSDHWGRSLSSLNWDDKKEKTETQQLISSTIKEWYEAKHRGISEEEVKLMNTVEITKCRLCEASEIIRYGKYRSGIKRYYCNECHHSFSALTNTIFEDRKIPISEWIEYLIHLFEFHSIRSSARDNRNANSTGKYWLIKVFSVLEGIQDNVMLSGDIYLDEMMFPVVKHKEVLKNGKKLKGISRNKIAVAAAYDSNGNYLFIVEYTSKPSDRSTWKALGTHIKEGSHLIHDGERSHGILIRRLGLTETVYLTAETKGLSDRDNPLDPINDIHSLAKRFMKAHGGYNRDDLQDWMNLIWFILSKPDNRYEKIEKFINLALYAPKKVKFRDVMTKKSSK